MHACIYYYAGDGGMIGPIEIISLEIFDISEFPGVQELDRSEADSSSPPINIPDGVIFGNQLVTSAFVCSYS